MKLGKGAAWKFPRAGRCHSVKTMIALLLGGLLALSAFPPSPPAAGAPGSAPEQGTALVTNAAAAIVNEAAPLDRSKTGELQTFTFGLG